jgi:transposase
MYGKKERSYSRKQDRHQKCYRYSIKRSSKSINSPEKVEALAILMGLCLLVYTLGQRQIRQALQQAESGIKNQLGKLTKRPTLRWIFQCFQAIHLLVVQELKQISNLTDERIYILRFFPDACRQY